MKDVMVDIEAFGDKCVVQIGACYFDRLSGEIGETFSRNIDARSCGQLDAETVYWWLTQSEQARNSILQEPRLPLNSALEQFNEFLKDAKYIWSHATYDFVVLSNAFFFTKSNRSNFSFRKAQDIRTLLALAEIDAKSTSIVREGVHHTGLDDAKYQVMYCVEAFRKLKIK